MSNHDFRDRSASSGLGGSRYIADGRQASTHAARTADDAPFPRSPWVRVIAGGAAALMVLAGCGDVGSGSTGGIDGQQAANGDSEEMSARGGSTSGNESMRELPRSSVDVCEGRNDDFLSHIACDVVAWADLDDDETLEPIAVATGGEPSISLLTEFNGRTVEYSATNDPDIQDPSKPGVLGPDVGTMEARRHAAFVGAYDLTGDGRPELVMWSDKGPTRDEFRVLSVGPDGLESLDTPIQGMHSFGGKEWSHYLSQGHPSFRCTGNPDAPLEYLAVSSGKLMSTRYEFDVRAEEFVDLDDRRRIEDWTGDVPVVGVECQDQALHEPQPEPDSESGPGSSERCPLGRLPGRQQSDDVGAFIEGTTTKGTIGCDRITELWDAYLDESKDVSDVGKGRIVDFGNHTCSARIDHGAIESGRIGGCTSLDESWAFDVVPR